MPGVVCVLTAGDLADLDPYWGHAIRDRPVVAIDRVRFAGEPVAAVAAEDEATSGRPERIVVGYEELGSWDDRGAGPDAPIINEARCAGLFRARRAGSGRGNVCYRYRSIVGRSRLSSRTPSSSSRRVRFRRLPVRDGDAHRCGAGRGERDHALVILPASFLVGPGSPRSSRCRSRRPVVVPYLGGGRIQVVHEDGADRSRPHRRPASGRIQNRVAESMVTTRRHGMRCRMRTTQPGGRAAQTRGRCWFDTGAYADNGPRSRPPQRPPRPYAGPRTAWTPPASANTAPPAPTAPSARPTCSGSESCRSTNSPPRGLDRGGRLMNLCTPGGAARGRQAARRRSHR
jgi:hypothetical protein